MFDHTADLEANGDLPLLVLDIERKATSRKGWCSLAKLPRTLRMPDGRFIKVLGYEDVDAWEQAHGAVAEAYEARPAVAAGAPKRDTSDTLAAEIAAWMFEINDDIAAADAYTAAQAPVTPVAPQAPAAPVTEGMYRMADGTIAKVQRAVNGSGNLYAKRLVVEADHGSFVYEPGLIRKLAAADKMSLDEAAEFGRLYGWCVVCGRTLTDERSIAAGIGPVCSGRGFAAEAA